MKREWYDDISKFLSALTIGNFLREVDVWSFKMRYLAGMESGEGCKHCLS